MASFDIVKELTRKGTNGDFETPVPIGTEQKFVSPLLNSQNNNLEEQSLLGVDCVTTIWEETVDDVTIVKTVKKFYNAADGAAVPNKFYILFITELKTLPTLTSTYTEVRKEILRFRTTASVVDEPIDEDIYINTKHIEMKEEINTETNITKTYTREVISHDV